MPEEVLESLNPEEEFRDAKDEDVMWPEPSLEQVSLWQEIDKTVNQTVLDRDNLFGSLPRGIKILLASEETSIKLMKIGQKYSLAPDQVIALSRYIRNLFTDLRAQENLDVPKLINTLCLNLDVSAEQGEKIFQEVNNEILLPALKDIVIFDTGPKAPPSQESKKDNIIDLKNLPK